MNYDLRLKKALLGGGAFNLESEIMKSLNEYRLRAAGIWNLKFKI